MTVTASIVSPKGSRRARDTGPVRRQRNLGTYFIALLFIAVCIGPVAYIVLGGFRSNSQITASPAGLPAPWQFDNYLAEIGRAHV